MRTSVAAAVAVLAVLLVPAPALADHAPGNACAEAHHDEPPESDPDHAEWRRNLNEACNPCAAAGGVGRNTCLRISHCRLFRPPTLAGEIRCARLLMRYGVRSGSKGLVAYKRKRTHPGWRAEYNYLRHVARSRR